MLLIGIDLGGKLEEQAELTDLDRLFHDIDAEEIVQDDALQREIAGVRVRADFASVALKSSNFFGAWTSPDRSRSATKGLHPVEACLVERFEDVERGEQERTGAAGRDREQ